jgi:hypothetical protein
MLSFSAADSRGDIRSRYKDSSGDAPTLQSAYYYFVKKWSADFFGAELARQPPTRRLVRAGGTGKIWAS